MHELIKKFISENHLLTFSAIEVVTHDKNTIQGVYSASCFYALDSENLALLIKSDSESRHIKLAYQNPHIALAIALNTQMIREIKGVQIRARFCEASAEQKKIYYKRFPFAKLGSGKIYALEILWAKYTDNSLLRAQKLEFNALD